MDKGLFTIFAINAWEDYVIATSYNGIRVFTAGALAALLLFSPLVKAAQSGSMARRDLIGKIKGKL
ncbi:MAG: hypothetical protein CSA09_00120 [Candidatus Contendobacter odensis]|uniref:Uncharacterized protein n=1 Tax=Candidatus Contendibacter odensensis TaxID=1400860 RepID=A0A2G6PGQ1_9GAMM|nr:MAG: hypothetical protein CSA09_00120 [Candidatus Contendobacter odensis]